MQVRFKLLLPLLLSALLIPVLPAAPIYSNGTGHLGGNNPFSQNGLYVAQDFTLLSGATLTSLSYNAYTTGSTVPVTAVNVKIYNNSAGSVGSQIYSGSFSVASQAATGTDGGYTLMDYFVDLPGWTLDSGTYWLGLRVDPPQQDMHWTIPTSAQLGYGSKIGNAAGDPSAYNAYSLEHSFSLFGTEGGTPPAAVPEPSTAILGLIGLAALSVSRRRRS